MNHPVGASKILSSVSVKVRFIQEVEQVGCHLFYHSLKESLVAALKTGYHITGIQNEVRVFIFLYLMYHCC